MQIMIDEAVAQQMKHVREVLEDDVDPPVSGVTQMIQNILDCGRGAAQIRIRAAKEQLDIEVKPGSKFTQTQANRVIGCIRATKA